MRKFPICVDCKFGLVMQRKGATGMQDPPRTVFCNVMKRDIADDVTFCSSHESLLMQLHPTDLMPVPQIVFSSNAATKRAMTNALTLLMSHATLARQTLMPQPPVVSETVHVPHPVTSFQKKSKKSK